ncbi:MAG TPA: hypothetical protein VHC71_14970 [Hyphomicrobium sp.]|nr:hypothetical protein [Hyphomicrobium sp.]
MSNDQKTCPNWKVVYRPKAHPIVAKKLREFGATDDEIAAGFNISLHELAFWRREHPDFAKACEVTAQTHDARIDRALLKLATGFTYKRKRPVNCNGILVMITDEVYVPPNLEAMKLWLEHRSLQSHVDEFTRGHTNPYLRSDGNE